MSILPGPIRRRIAMTKAYKEVFNSIDGRIVLRDLMKKAGLLSAEAGEFDAGRRSLMLEILAELRFDEEKLLEVATERMDEMADQE